MRKRNLTSGICCYSTLVIRVPKQEQTRESQSPVDFGELQNTYFPSVHHRAENCKASEEMLMPGLYLAHALSMADSTFLLSEDFSRVDSNTKGTKFKMSHVALFEDSIYDF